MRVFLNLLILLSVFAFSSVQASVFENSNVESAKKSDKKSEPAPKDKDERTGSSEGREPRMETYEGNDRGQGNDAGGGRFDEGSGGFAGELFSVPFGRLNSGTTTVKTEDRGDVVVQTVIRYEEISAEESCYVKTVTVIDKATRKVISSDTEEFCNRYSL